jgi:hypothetical protein
MIPAQKPRHSLAESDALPLRRAVLQHSAVAQNYQGMASERSRCHGSIWLDPGPRMEAERLCRVGLGAGSKTLAATHFAASLIADLTNRLGFRRLENAHMAIRSVILPPTRLFTRCCRSRWVFQRAHRKPQCTKHRKCADWSSQILRCSIRTHRSINANSKSARAAGLEAFVGECLAALWRCHVVWG